MGRVPSLKKYPDGQDLCLVTWDEEEDIYIDIVLELIPLMVLLTGMGIALLCCLSHSVN